MKKLIFISLLFLSCERELLNKLELYDGFAIGYPTGDVLICATLYNAGDIAVTEIECQYTLKTFSDTLIFNEIKTDTLLPGDNIGLYHQFKINRGDEFFGNIKILGWKKL